MHVARICVCANRSQLPYEGADATQMAMPLLAYATLTGYAKLLQTLLTDAKPAAIVDERVIDTRPERSLPVRFDRVQTAVESAQSGWDQWTALLLAARFGHLECCVVLCERTHALHASAPVLTRRS